MTIVKMLQSRKGEDYNGSIRQYLEGKTYDMPESTARLFYQSDWAVRGVLADCELSMRELERKDAWDKVTKELELAIKQLNTLPSLPTFNVYEIAPDLSEENKG